jgi:broad specificity phosphatase PhoE
VLIFVRHGRTAHNASRRLLGRLDIPLDPLGERQAAALANVPDLAKAARVVSSPLLRTRQTASALGLPVTLDERWLEIDYGSFDGCRLEDVPPEVWTGYRADPEYAPDGGESLGSVSRRVQEACSDLVVEAVDVDVVVVSHVSPIKAAVAWALGAGDAVTWRLYLDTASVTRVGVAPGASGLSLRGFNDVSGRPSV